MTHYDVLGPSQEMLRDGSAKEVVLGTISAANEIAARRKLQSEIRNGTFPEGAMLVEK